MPRPSRVERLFRSLLRVFPAEFRGDFGDQMSADFQDQYHDARAFGGRRTLARLWARTVIDALKRGPREHLDILARDAGYAWRLLRRRPGLAASALLTLTIGIGLNTAVFSVVSGVLWRELAISGGDRIVRIYEVAPPPESKAGSVSPANFLDWRSQARTLDELAAVGGGTANLVGGVDPEEIGLARVSAGFFRMAPARPLFGRLFNDADYAPLEAAWQARDSQVPFSRPRVGVVLLSHALWMRQFHGRPNVVGTRVRLGNDSVEVVGVLGPEFDLPAWADAWVPDILDASQRRARYVTAFGRLAPGVRLEQARSELDVIARQLADAYPAANRGYGIEVRSLVDSIVNPARSLVWFLFGAAACVLLVACANVANLLLAQASGRRLELATRVALGAWRGHLIRQSVTEGTVLACVGGAAGVLLAYWTLPLLVSLSADSIPRLDEVRVDGRVLAFSTALSIGIGVACGLVASLSIDALNPRSGFRISGAAAGAQGRGFRQTVTVVEIAVALMLVIGAGLLVRTMRVVSGLDLGFDRRNVLAIGLSPDRTKYPNARARLAFEADVLAGVRALPEVIAAGIGSSPLRGGGGGLGTRVTLASDPATPRQIAVDVVSPGYLDALGVRLLSGRFFADGDALSTPRVAIVNDVAARRFWPDRSAIGQSVIRDDREAQIVGVIGDVRRQDLEADPEPTLYLPSAQTPNMSTGHMLVRTAGDPRESLPAIREVLR